MAIILTLYILYSFLIFFFIKTNPFVEQRYKRVTVNATGYEFDFLVKRQCASLSSATQHAMPSEFRGKRGT